MTQDVYFSVLFEKNPQTAKTRVSINANAAATESALRELREALNSHIDALIGVVEAQEPQSALTEEQA